MNQSVHSDDEILAGLRRRLSDVESLVPQPPELDPAIVDSAPVRSGVVVRSRVGLGGFAALALVAALLVVAVGVGVSSRNWSGNGGATPTPPQGGSGTIIVYQLVPRAGQSVTEADLGTTVTILEARALAAGADLANVTPLPPDQIWVAVRGVGDTTQLRALLAQSGKVEFVLLPPDQYGTSDAPGPKALPEQGSAIDPSLPVQFTGADLDPTKTMARADAGNTGGWVVDFGFKESAASAFDAWSGQHVRDFFAIAVDGEVQAAPYIYAPITDGIVTIGGNYTKDAAAALATTLQYGALPMPIREVSVTQVNDSNVITASAEPSQALFTAAAPTLPAATSPGPIVPPGVTTPADIPTNDRTIGDASAPVTLDVWLDYQCPSCRAITDDLLPRLSDKYLKPGKVRVAFHNFIVIDNNVGGRESLDAASAALCAADQGQFAKYQAWLLANQGQEGSGAFTKARLEEIARAAGLDMTSFQPCVERGTHDAEVQVESASVPPSVVAVPAILVNGTLATSNSYEDIQSAIEAALRTASRSAMPPPSPSPFPSPSEDLLPSFIHLPPAASASPGTS